jgi:8-amino-7-oxononanoate synthase
MYNDFFLNKKLNQRIANNALRTLKLPNNLIDFCSNDYLGIVKNNLLQIAASPLKLGSTGSRLLAGNDKLIEETEKQIAQFHNANTALIFNSGYDANIGLLSCVPQRGDTILYDYLCHASIRDGIRLSFANSFAFEHNSLIDLEKKIQQAKGTIFIVTESIFSMDGDAANLLEIVAIATKYNANIIVDEAHATGVIGNNGEGLVQQLNLQNNIFARVHTFGKACGCHGAVILGSNNLRNYLINFARSFVYTTSLPQHSVAAISQSYKVFAALNNERMHLQNLIQLFNNAVLKYPKIQSNSAIQAVIINGNNEVRNVANMLQQNGFDIRAILYPTVPKNSERLRIVLHSFNTINEVEKLIELLS